MDGADSFLHMTFMGGLTDVVGVIGRFGDEVVMLDVFVVVKLLAELVRVLEVVILEVEDELEFFRLELEVMEEPVLELEVDLLDI